MGWVGSGSLIWMGELGVHCRVQIAAYRICALAMNKFGTGSRLRFFYERRFGLPGCHVRGEKSVSGGTIPPYNLPM